MIQSHSACAAQYARQSNLRSSVFCQLRASKKGADPNQIFIYIAAIVIVGFIFLYGFKAVNTFLKAGEDITLAKFVSDFKKQAGTVSTDFRSIQYVDISIPDKFNRICIVDISEAPPASGTGDACDSPHTTVGKGQLTAEICSLWEELHADSISSSPSMSPKNVFFIGHDQKVGYSDFIPDIKIENSPSPAPPAGENFVCTSEGRIKLQGEARIAKVSLE